ncbi:S-adenosyl-L-methionine-dependent methyltransferase [Cunninghamella echinulata]|nr:S-adenosyl-L-methionine-dependent methyltransferase [Cunninghamella echinulata]
MERNIIPSTVGRKQEFSGSVYSTSEYAPSEYDPQDESWEDWENEDMDSQCLFCSLTFPVPEETFNHCKTVHGFDFLNTKRSLGLDFYKCIRMINYIRREAQEHPELSEIKEYGFTGKESFWNDDTLLQPVLDDDALLHAFEELDLLDETEGDEYHLVDKTTGNTTATTMTNKPIDITKIQPTTDLEIQLLQLLQETLERNQNLEGQFEQYKTTVKSTFYDHLLDNDDKSVVGGNKSEYKGLDDVGNYYFNGYAHNDIHEQMLKDRARTEAYRDFVYENKDVFKDKIVLDVGCGTGILSMFAAKAGAKQVISVDNSEIIEKAKLNVKENGLDHIITLVQGKVEEIDIPVKQVDIIISEWMGYFLLFEAMLDSVLVARDRWLAPNGIMAPSHTRILMAALDDEDLKDDRVNFWNDVYGFKMTAMKEPVINEALIDFVKSSTVISDLVTLKDLYLQTITTQKLDFVTKFEMVVKRDGTIYAFGGWFDTWFTRDGHPIPLTQAEQRVDGEIFLTTGPFGEDTHWKQTIFILETPLQVKQGSRIIGTFICHKGLENSRELECEIEFCVDGGETHIQQYMVRA